MGATVVVYNSVALVGEIVIVGLQASGWTAIGPNSYAYKGAPGAAITAAIFKPNLITFKGGKASWGYTLNEPAQGSVAAAFIVGNTFYCANAPAKPGGDRIDKFTAQAKTPAPLFCVSP